MIRRTLAAIAVAGFALTISPVIASAAAPQVTPASTCSGGHCTHD
jgi:hypothetical protein